MSTFQRFFVRLIQACLSIFFMAVIFSQQLHAQGKYQVASQRELTAADLQGKSGAELKIMRNEIFARYGYIFKTKDMKEYFAGQSWYRPTAADVTGKLTAIEKKNVELIKKAESGQIAMTPPKPLVPSSNAAGLYPEASARILNGSELSGMTTKQLSIMRNEIFARHGYIFKTTDMKEYFGRQSWYRPSASDVSSVLTVIEKQNIETIKKFETLNNVNLEVNGRQVADIVPYYDSGLMEGSGTGYAVVIYKSGSPAWSVHRFNVSDRLQVYGYDHNSSSDRLWEEAQRILEKALLRVSNSDIVSSIDHESVLEGEGIPPTLSTTGEGGVGIAIRDNKMLKLYSDDKFWADYELKGPGWDDGPLVLLPTSSGPGRTESMTIRSVIYKDDNEEALWFFNENMQAIFASSEVAFAYRPKTNTIQRYLNLGRGFATIEFVNGKKVWVLYTSSSGEGLVLPIPTTSTISYQHCEGDNDLDFYCSFAVVYTNNDSKNSISYLIDLRDALVYKFPTGTTLTDGYSGINLGVPGLGDVWVNSDCNIYDRDNEPIQLSRFIIK